jgi:hypothetical protein
MIFVYRFIAWNAELQGIGLRAFYATSQEEGSQVIVCVHMGERKENARYLLERLDYMRATS